MGKQAAFPERTCCDRRWKGSCWLRGAERSAHSVLAGKEHVPACRSSTSDPGSSPPLHGAEQRLPGQPKAPA